jgi:hypothetical protein
MTNRLEDELRELFGTTADRFEMDGTMPPGVRKRARARAFRALSAVVGVAILAGGLSVVSLRAHPAGQRATSAAVPGITLVDYVNDSPYPDLTAAKEQARCMRDQGFDFPDPVQNGTGWQIALPSSIDQSSYAWREALFVTCAISKFANVPPPEHLGFVAPTLEDAQALVDCMQAQGFHLPAPTQQGDRYEIDLSHTSIDTSSDAWNQALLVTCTPPQPPWVYPSGSIGPTGGGSSGPSGQSAASGSSPSEPSG